MSSTKSELRIQTKKKEQELKVEKYNVDAAIDALANNFTDALANKLDVSITNRLS